MNFVATRWGFRLMRSDLRVIKKGIKLQYVLECAHVTAALLAVEGIVTLSFLLGCIWGPQSMKLAFRALPKVERRANVGENCGSIPVSVLQRIYFR
jgi:hypothetical protein